MRLWMFLPQGRVHKETMPTGGLRVGGVDGWCHVFDAEHDKLFCPCIVHSKEHKIEVK